jgi:hypothetical protein
MNGSSVTSIKKTGRYKFCAAGWVFTIKKKGTDGLALRKLQIYINVLQLKFIRTLWYKMIIPLLPTKIGTG